MDGAFDFDNWCVEYIAGIRRPAQDTSGRADQAGKVCHSTIYADETSGVQDDAGYNLCRFACQFFGREASERSDIVMEQHYPMPFGQ
jgi:hypothetical protein